MSAAGLRAGAAPGLGLALGLALALAACAPAQRAPGAAADGAAEAADPATAWLVLERVQDPQLALRMARVHLNDRALTGLAPGERRRIAVAPGRHRVTVDLWDQPGQCVTEVALAAGQSLALTVSPRREALAAATPGALVPDPLLGVAVMAAAQAAESAGRPCGGAFRIEPAGPPGVAATPAASASRP